MVKPAEQRGYVRKYKAVALISGGLDSLLAARVVQDEGIEILSVCFLMSFASKDIRTFCGNVLESAVAASLPEVRMVDIGEDFLKVLSSPKHGYGSQINPCIDCKILMLKKAREIMLAEKADFIVTGEVLEERPMSQRRDALLMIQKESGVGDRLLRPLSAQLLDETLAEKEGMISRSRLLSIHGRSRNAQFALADKLGITRYFKPAGGCLLTDPCFSMRIRDLLKNEKLLMEDVELLRYGRHFRLDEKTKAVVGRDDGENTALCSIQSKDDVMLRLANDVPGPYVLLRGDIKDNNIIKAAQLCVLHSKRRKSVSADVEWWVGAGGEKEDVTISMENVKLDIEKMRI